MEYEQLFDYINTNFIKNGTLKASVIQWKLVSKIENDIRKYITVHTNSDSELLYRIMNMDNSIHYCECGKEVLFNKFSKGFRKFCSVSCSKKSKSVREKFEKTMTQKYGSAYPLLSKEIKKKIFNTNINKYNTEFPQRNSEIKQKVKNTCLEKYGLVAANCYGSNIYKKNMMNKYGVENAMHLNYFVLKSQFNSSSSMNLKQYYSKYGLINYQTNLELNFIKFCEELNIEVKNGPKIEYVFNKSKHQNNKKFLFLLDYKNYETIKEDL